MGKTLGIAGARCFYTPDAFPIQQHCQRTKTTTMITNCLIIFISLSTLTTYLSPYWLECHIHPLKLLQPIPALLAVQKLSTKGRSLCHMVPFSILAPFLHSWNAWSWWLHIWDAALITTGTSQQMINYPQNWVPLFHHLPFHILFLILLLSSPLHFIPSPALLCPSAEDFCFARVISMRCIVYPWGLLSSCTPSSRRLERAQMLSETFNCKVSQFYIRVMTQAGFWQNYWDFT